MSQKNAFCLITIRPTQIWTDFLNTMTDDYDVFMIVDDNSVNIDRIRNVYHKITFIQIDDDECKNSGYWDSSFMVKKNPSGWDKALYYFIKINHDYSHHWFCEDDVFFYNVRTICHIDKANRDADLLCNTIETNNEGYRSDWHWQQAKPYFNLPWAKAMVCCCRLSTRLLERIAGFVDKHHKLTFIECLFPTLAQGLVVDTPPSFSTIHWRNEWTNFRVNPLQLYHPFKNVEDHQRIRQGTYGSIYHHFKKFFSLR